MGEELWLREWWKPGGCPAASALSRTDPGPPTVPLAAEAEPARPKQPGFYRSGRVLDPQELPDAMSHPAVSPHQQQSSEFQPAPRVDLPALSLKRADGFRFRSAVHLP